MRYKYFVGYEHQKIHAEFIQSVLGGDYVVFRCDSKEQIFPEELLAHDGEDVVWFFNNLYYHLHPKLKGKQILIDHGLGFNRFMTKQKVKCINQYIDLVFGLGVTDEIMRLESGVDPKKIRKIGYTLLFQIPPFKVEFNSVLFASTYFINWNQYRNLEEILKHLDPRIKGYVTIHPSTPDKLRNRFVEICRKSDRLVFIHSQEDLLKAYALCECVVGQVSSVCTPFWYMGKPVIFLRGTRVGTNPIKGTGWGRIKRQINLPLFSQVLDESTKISHWSQFSFELIKNAKISKSAKKMFYPSNGDKKLTVKKIRQCLSEIDP